MMREIFVGLMMLVMLVFNSPTGELSTPPEVMINQVELHQGDVLIIGVRDAQKQPEATFLGRPLHFEEQADRWVALSGISYWTEPGQYILQVQLPNGNQISQEIVVKKGDFKESYLTVSEDQSKKVQPKPEDTAIVQRKKHDSELVAEAYSFSHPTPLWSGPFIRPTEGRITTSYGATRYVNGKLNNRHSGLDIANQLGTPIYATNAGQVRLATELLVTGNTVIVDHGAGLYSSYSHMSAIYVKPGDHVTAGQQIGAMGSTGFSTGSHLHWVMKIGDAYLNPEPFVGSTLLDQLSLLIQ